MARCAWWSRERSGPAGHAEQLGNLRRGIAHEVVEHEDGALIRRETPECPLELVAVCDAQEVVRGDGRLDGHDAQVCDAAALARCLADAHVGQDAVEPGAEPVRIAEAREVTPGDHQRVLQGVLGPVDVPKDPVRNREAAVAMKANQVDECLLVAMLGRYDEIPIHSTRPGWRPSGTPVQPYR